MLNWDTRWESSLSVLCRKHASPLKPTKKRQKYSAAVADRRYKVRR